jgi:hypothetical protein
MVSAPLLQIGTVNKTARIMNAVMAVIKLAVLVYFIMYAVRVNKGGATNLTTYHDMLLPALIVVFLFASPVVAVLVLVAWAVLKSCNRDIFGLLVAIVVLLTIEVMYQIGVVVTGRVALGVVGPASMRLGMGVVGRSRASRLSLRA